MIFIQVCVAAIMCATVFITRWIIVHIFHNQKQWSKRPYWWIIWANAAVILTKFGIVGFVLALVPLALWEDKFFKKKGVK